MIHYVYILYSATGRKFYKGQTSNLAERLGRHNNGLEISTKHDAPWQMVWSTEKPSRSEAFVLERKLKNIGFQRTINFILKYRAGITDTKMVKEFELLTN